MQPQPVILGVILVAYSLWIFFREDYDETGAVAETAFDADLSSVIFNDAMANRKAKPCAAAGSFGGEKWGEDARDTVRGYALSIIGDQDQEFTVSIAGSDLDFQRVIASSINGIDNQIDPDAL